jgi:hypothetical protein
MFTFKPNINEIYDTEENERFMLVCSAAYSNPKLVVLNDFKPYLPPALHGWRFIYIYKPFRGLW